jgi:hypothetical protein
MSEMGMAICCLMCDAPDDVGSARCKACIGRHERVREMVARGDGEITRLGRELLAMMAAPERHDHDEVHGEVLRGYGHLLAQHEGPRTPPTQVEIDALFAAAKARPKGSLIRDMANRNPWKDAPPSAGSARSMSDEMQGAEHIHAGMRTVPSRKIETTSRSDRLGEDSALTDRVAANAAVQDAPEELKDVLADAHVAERKAKRDKWKSAVEELDELLDD